MRLLVTGGAGYIGSITARLLREAGHEVTVVDDLSAHRNAGTDGDLVVADIRDTAGLNTLLRERSVEGVMHFAALKSVADSWRRPEEYHQVNVGGTVSLLDAMPHAQVPLLVFSGTAAIYGAPKTLPVTEEELAAPLNPYGETKLLAEREIAARAARGDVRFCTLRYFNAAGATLDGSMGEQAADAPNLVPVVIGAALGKRSHVPIYGTDYSTDDGTAERDYVHVLDLAAAHLLALEYLRDGGESAAFNLGTGRATSVREIVAAAERITGRPIPVREEPRRAGDAPAIWADPTRANQRLGWTAHYGTDEILETAWRWYQHRPA
jgi:UDP-glucose 4-epimerase